MAQPYALAVASRSSHASATSTGLRSSLLSQRPPSGCSSTRMARIVSRRRQTTVWLSPSCSAIHCCGFPRERCSAISWMCSWERGRPRDTCGRYHPAPIRITVALLTLFKFANWLGSTQEAKMKRSNPPEGGPTHGLDLRVAQRMDIDVHDLDLDDRATQHFLTGVDGIAFACLALAAAEALRIGLSGHLLSARGDVLAKVDDHHGHFTAAPSIGVSEPPAYGWYRTAEDVVFHVQVIS